MAYATLADAHIEIKVSEDDATEDVAILRMLDVASNRIAALWGHPFEPYRRTLPVRIEPQRIQSVERLFKVDKWFLTLNSVTVYNTALTVGTQVEAYINGYPPYRALRLKDTANDWYYTWADRDYAPLVLIGADWGYHPRYSLDAWQDSGDSVQDGGGINATVTTVTVTDADGTDWANRTPRFSAGQLIRIDTEWLRVMATDTTANTLTVRRGENGSTAAVHANAAQIDSYYPPDDVRQVVARQAGLLYKRRGAYDIPQGDFGGAAYPRDLEVMLLDVLQAYTYHVGP